MTQESQSRGAELAEKSDTPREELLEVIERANDELCDAVPNMNTYVSHDEVRPSAVSAFDRMQNAIDELSQVDPTRGNGDN